MLVVAVKQLQESLGLEGLLLSQEVVAFGFGEEGAEEVAVSKGELELVFGAQSC